LRSGGALAFGRGAAFIYLALERPSGCKLNPQLKIPGLQGISHNKVYAHRGLSLFIRQVRPALIRCQQAEFMSKSLGSSAVYRGPLPAWAP
ncbi:MAG: hypothetical protein ACI8X5_003562, partial [Planctomycetota bacterium]